MVSKVTIEYKRPLRGGDSFVVCINTERRGAKLVFLQEIYNKADSGLSAKAEIDVIALKNGRLTRGEVFDVIFKELFDNN